MRLEAIVFDLDLTLIASSPAEELRRRRAWPEVYKLIPALEPYEGINSLIAAIHRRGLKTAIVTSSPGSYCNRVIGHWNWPIATTVCYHDTTRKKPHPEPILKALKNLDVSAENTIAVGDTGDDVLSARAAGVFAIGALWGSQDPDALLQAKPDFVVATVRDLAQYIDRQSR